MRAPKLRFPTFDDEWKSEKLSNLFFIRSSGDLDKEKLSLEKKESYCYPVYGNALTNGGLLGYYKTFEEDAPAITVTGRGEIGKPIFRNEPFNAVGRLLVLHLKDKNYNSYFFTLSISLLKIFNETTGVPQLTAPSLGKYIISFPSKLEQDKLGDFFSKIDKKIQLQQEKIDLLKEQKKGYMQKIYSQELRFKNKNKDYPKWKQTMLGEIAEIVGGGTPSTTKEQYWNGGISWFTPTEISSKKYVNQSYRTISKEGLQNSSAKLLPKGTVLLTTRATLGEMAILLNPAATNQGFQSLIPKQNTSSEFLYYLQPQIRKYCYSNASGSTFLEISKHSLKKMPVLLPSIEEQERITSFLSKIDYKITLEEEKLNTLIQNKKAFMQQMFI